MFRYRKPSLKTVLGVTKAKKRVNKALGITAMKKPFRAWGNAKRRVKRKVGYYSTPAKIMRNGVPTPGGCLLPVIAGMVLILLFVMLI